VEEDTPGGLTLWLPLVDGAERLGVLELRTETLDGLKLWRCRAMASLMAMIINSRRAYSDTFAQRTRIRPMQLHTEMLRAFLPPRSIGTGQVVSTAVLEPAYGLGGDAFDHSFTEGFLHATILDGMGHDLSSGVATSVAMAGCRNARRTGADLAELVDGVDQALTTWLPDQFCTGIFTQLHMPTGFCSTRTASWSRATSAGSNSAWGASPTTSSGRPRPGRTPRKCSASSSTRSSVISTTNSATTPRF
jgi:serine phosphatase RsbU (regulator of sigma subunit)